MVFLYFAIWCCQVQTTCEAPGLAKRTLPCSSINVGKKEMEDSRDKKLEGGLSQTLLEQVTPLVRSHEHNGGTFRGFASRSSIL
ncbi:hypothetical protein V6Z12_D03G063700 [Gossypium hirsutum]